MNGYSYAVYISQKTASQHKALHDRPRVDFPSHRHAPPIDGHRDQENRLTRLRYDWFSIREVIDGKIRAVNKKVAKRDHGRRFSAVIRTHENCRLLGEVYPYGLKLSKVADLDMSNVHGVSLYVLARRLLGQRG